MNAKLWGLVIAGAVALFLLWATGQAFNPVAAKIDATAGSVGDEGTTEQ